MQAGLNHQINLPQGQKRVSIAIHAVAGQLTLFSHGVEGLSLAGAADLREGGEDRRLGQVTRVARGKRSFDPLALHKGHAKSADKTLPRVGLIDQTKNWRLPIIQSNQSAPSGRSADIAAGAINRIKHPGQTRCAHGVVRLFANHRILRTLGFQHRAHGSLGRLIGLSHRVKPLRPLVLRNQGRGAKPLQGLFGRRISQLRGKG